MSPVLGHTSAAVLMAGGVVACVIALLALRLMALHWKGMKRLAAGQQRMVHVVRSPLDRFGQVLWCVVYAVGGLAAVCGLWMVTA